MNRLGSHNVKRKDGQLLPELCVAPFYCSHCPSASLFWKRACLPGLPPAQAACGTAPSQAGLPQRLYTQTRRCSKRRPLTDSLVCYE